MAGELAVQLVIGGLAALLVFWGLGDKYLWQDEAATAVLGARMLQFGRPLAYDGVNLVPIDIADPAEARGLDQRTTDPRVAVAYYVSHGYFKADTSWKYHPWGQFVVAALSFKALGRTTVAARLPFALAGLITVLLTYRLARAYGGGSTTAILASALLAVNSYWVLHARQCRYYSLSGLFLVLTLLAYLRWQRGGRWGAAAFVTAAWCWSQVDYGTIWPVLGVLFLDAFVARPRAPWRPAAVGAALAAAIAPTLYYYEVVGRPVVQEDTWPIRFRINLFNLNEFVAPALVALLAVALLLSRWRILPELERRLVAVSCAVLVGLAFWVPTVGGFAFLRYVIVAAPVGAVLAAWVLVQGTGTRAQAWAWLGAAVLALTPWASLPLRPLVPAPHWIADGHLVRSELWTLAREVFGHRPDPNRLVVEWLRANASPTDEILVSYEDAPLLFYLPNPVRGGMAAFRAEDDARTPPRFVVLRQALKVPWAWSVLVREVRRYEWVPVPLRAPDVAWGNNPDPMAYARDPRNAPPLFIARRRDTKGP